MLMYVCNFREWYVIDVNICSFLFHNFPSQDSKALTLEVVKAATVVLSLVAFFVSQRKYKLLNLLMQVKP